MRNNFVFLIIKIFYIIAVLIGLYSFQDSANIDSLSIRSVPSSIDSHTNQKMYSSGLTEVEAYKLLYDNAKQANDRMQNSINFVIGTVIVFIVLILGSQIYFNWRINEKEIEKIEKAIDQKNIETKIELSKEIRDYNKEETEKLQAIIENYKRELRESMDKQSRLLEMKSTVDIDNLKYNIQSEINIIKIDLERNKGDIWLIRGIEENALSSYIRMALLEQKEGKELNYTLNDIIELLEKREEIHEYDYNRLDELTNKLEYKYLNQKNKIILNYKNKPVFKYVDIPKQSKHDFLPLLNLPFWSSKKYVKNEPKQE